MDRARQIVADVIRVPAAQRMRYVELRIAGEAVLVIIVATIFIGIASDFGYPWRVISAAIVAAFAGLAIFRRSRERLTNWRLLNEWRTRPIRIDRGCVIQDDCSGRMVARIDTNARYSVRWERFDDDLAVYRVSQGNDSIAVSTRDPAAREVLVNALRVANYPCEEWPKFDL